MTPEATICGVAQDRRAGPQRAAGRRDDAGGVGEVADEVDHARRRGSCGRRPAPVGRQPGQVGLGADGGERAAVDLRAVPDVLCIPRTALRRRRRGRGAGRAGEPQRRAQPDRCTRSVNRPGREARAGVGAHVGQRLGAARSPGAGAHQRHRRRGVDDEPGGASCASRRRPRRGRAARRAPRRDPHAPARPAASTRSCAADIRRAPARTPAPVGTGRRPAEAGGAGGRGGVLLLACRRAGRRRGRPRCRARQVGDPPGAARGPARGTPRRRAAPARAPPAGTVPRAARGRAAGRRGPRPAATGPAPARTTSPRPSSRANRNRPDSAASAGRAHSPRPARGRAAHVGEAARDPGRAGRRDVARALVRRRRQQPGRGEPGGQPAASSRRRPRSCRLPREVRCTAPSPRSSAQPATTCSAAA